MTLTLKFASRALLDSENCVKRHGSNVHGLKLATCVRSLLDPIFATEAPFEEDFGWGFYVEGNGRRYFVGASAEPDKVIAECFVTIGVENGLFRSRRLREDDPIIQKIVDELMKHPEVSDLEVLTE